MQNKIYKLLLELHNKEVKVDVLSYAWKRKKAVDLDHKHVKMQRQELQKDASLIMEVIGTMAKKKLAQEEAA